MSKIMTLALTGVGFLAVTACTNKSGFRSSPSRTEASPVGATSTSSETDPNSETTPAPLDPGTVNPKIDADQTGSKPGELTPILVFKGETVAAIGVQELKQEADRFAWTVTQAGTVSYFKIANDTVTATKKWTGATPSVGGGARTYVLEGGGLVVIRSGGEAFFIDPAKPEGNLRAIGAPFYQKLSVPGVTIATDARGCAVSYRRIGKRMVGIGVGAGGDFIEVPQQDTAPFAPDWSKAIYRGKVNPKGTGWGYSCFIDQQRLIYYGAWVNESVKAFNLVTGLEVDPTSVAANGAFTSSTLPAQTLGPKSGGGGSYAISGDSKGNVLNGSAYTMAFDGVHQAVWVTSAAGEKIDVYPAACFSNQKVCTGQASFVLASGNGKGIGPISALGDGSILGLSRGGYGGDNALYSLSLKDPKDITKGINVKKLATLDDDPYMYTDFTGATLYLTKAEQRFDLTQLNYKLNQPLAQVGFTWVTRDGQPAEWANIDVELRCYASSAGAPPAFEKVTEAIQSSTKQSFISTPSCAKGRTGIDTIDLRLTQLNNATTLMNIRKVQITAYQ